MQTVSPHRRKHHSSTVFDPTSSAANVGYWNPLADASGVVDNQYLTKQGTNLVSNVKQQHPTIGGDATLQGGANAPLWVDERFGTGKDAIFYNISAPGDWLEVAHYSQIAFDKDDAFAFHFSFELPSGHGGAINTAIYKGFTGGTAGIDISFVGDKLRFQVGDGANFFILDTVNTWADDTKHVAHVKKSTGVDENSATVVIDSVGQALTTVSPGTLTGNLGTTLMAFGARNGGTFELDGYLGGVIIDNVVTNAARDANTQALLI